MFGLQIPWVNVIIGKYNILYINGFCELLLVFMNGMINNDY